MQPLVLLISDHAYIDKGTGKLYILGAFNALHARQAPVRHERMSLVIRIAADFGDHTKPRMLTVILMDEDAEEILKLSVPFTLPVAPDGDRPHFDLVGELENVIFPRFGRYVFRVYVEDDEIGTIPVDVIETKQ